MLCKLKNWLDALKCSLKCHISYHALFCSYLPRNSSKQNWQNGLCYFFWSWLLVNKVYTFKWILLRIIFRLYYTAGTDSKNCHKVCSLSHITAALKTLILYTFPCFPCLSAVLFCVFFLEFCFWGQGILSLD